MISNLSRVRKTAWRLAVRVFSLVILQQAILAASAELDLRHVARLLGFTGGIYSLTLDGSRLFVCHQGGGMSIVDVSDPANPSILGTYNSPGAATGVAVSGPIAYLADGESGLQVVDVSDTANPRRIGGFNTPGYATRVAVKDTHAFVADGSRGLEILDISDPTLPVRIGQLSTSRGISDVKVSGNYAFLAAGNLGVGVVDVSNLASPVLVTNINPGDHFVGTVALSGDSIYASAGRAFMLNVRVPNEPVFVSYLVPRADVSTGVAASSRFVGLATDSAPISIMQNQGLLPPIMLGRTFVENSLVTAIAINDSHVFVAAGSLIGIFALEEPANPRTVATLAVAATPTGSTPRLLAGGNDVLRLIRGETVLTLGTTNPLTPVVLATNQLSPFGAVGWTESGDRAVGWRAGRYWTLDVADPEQPQLVAGFVAEKQWSALILDGQQAYAGGFNFLSWLDLSDLAQPKTVTTITNEQVYRSFALAGQYLYAQTQEPAVQIFDVSRMGDFQMVGSLPFDSLSSFQIVSNRLYVFRSQQPALVVYSLDNPLAPERIGALSHWRIMGSGLFHGSFLYARVSSIGGEGGFEVFDVSEPGAIRRVGGNSQPTSALATDGRALYAVTGGGLRTLSLYAEMQAFRPMLPALADGAFRFQVRGIPGTSVQVQRAGDLSGWQDWQSLTFEGDTAVVVDSEPQSTGGRFYRVVLP